MTSYIGSTSRKPYRIELRGELAIVPLSNGGEAVIDAQDVPLVQTHCWTRDAAGYARRTNRSSEKGNVVRMHRLILGCREGEMVDHINGERLDNRRTNLRLASRAQNAQNRGANSGRQFKGVAQVRSSSKWKAKIFIAGKQVHLGVFDSAELAARAYDAAASAAYGDSARLNFP